MDLETQLEEAFWNAEEKGEHYRLVHPETSEEVGILELRGDYQVYLEPFTGDDESFVVNIESKTLDEFVTWVSDRVF